MNPPEPRAPMIYDRALPRRAMLAVGISALIGGGISLAGCTPPTEADDPAPAPSSTPTPTPTLAGAESAAQVEGRLADQADALLAAAETDKVARSLAGILITVSAGHRAHQSALTDPRPTSRPSGPKPKPTSVPAPKNVIAALKKLITDEEAAARKLAENANREKSITALLWASLAASAAGYAQALRLGGKPAKTPKPVVHRPVEPIDPVAATRSMIEQLHAIGYGYQAAIGHLPEDQFEQAATALRNHRSLRDRLIANLVDDSADVPAAAPAYDLPVQPRDAKTAAKLIMTMETSLLPFCGQWVAAADSDKDRELAVATLRTTALSSITWGGPLLTWPGFVEQ